MSKTITAIVEWYTEKRVAWWFKISSYSIEETFVILIAAILPAAAVLLSGAFVHGGNIRFNELVMNYLLRGECIVLAASLLGTAFVNMLDIGGEKVERWAAFQKTINCVLAATYLLVFSCESVVKLFNVKCASASLTKAQVVFLAVSCVVLLLSNFWRRRNMRFDDEKENPYSKGDAAFAANFGARVKSGSK